MGAGIDEILLEMKKGRPKPPLQIFFRRS